MKRLQKKIIFLGHTLGWILFFPLATSCNGFHSHSIILESPETTQKREIELPEKNNYDEAVIFCGNPGVGKSCLLNTLLGEDIFRSGNRFGTGMTTKEEEYIYQNKKYIDTPGLSDIQLREQAGLAIETTLKQHKPYKLVFIITLESGRIKPDDFVTINKICEALPDNCPYGLVINKVTKGILAELNEHPDNLENYLSPLTKKPALHPIYIEKDYTLEEEEEVHTQHLHAQSPAKKQLMDLLESLPPCHTTPEQIGKIDVTNYEKKKEELELRIAQIMQALHEQKLLQDAAKYGGAAGGAVGGTVGGTVGAIIGAHVVGIPTAGVGIPIGILVGGLVGGTIGAGANYLHQKDTIEKEKSKTD